MSRMTGFEREAKVEILPISGMLRVTVVPRPSSALMLIEIAAAFVFGAITVRQWSSMSFLMRAFYIWCDVSTLLAFLYQLSGFEQIEFGPEKLTIRKSMLAWERTREYPVEDCTELEWHHSSGENRGSCLHCKVGWKMVFFARYISETQALEIISALQEHFPQVSRKMAAMPGGKSHFQTLGLS
jgi:hypothetical protein